MKRSVTLLAALVVLSVWIAGCNSGPTQKEIKDAFVRQLVGFCAEVNRQLAKIPGGAKAEPEIAADQFALLAKQARDYQPKPDIDRDKFEIMLTEIDKTAGQYRSAQAALTAGDQPTADAALAQADRQFKSANDAAQNYGMPPLETCPQHESGTPAPGASAAPAPAAGWLPRHEMALAVQQVNATVLNGRIWVAGGLDQSGEATASTQFYDPVINSWEQGPPLPEPVHHAMLVTYRDQLVVIGGFHSRDNDLLAVTSPRMLLLDNKTDKWVDGPPLRHPRAAGGAAVVGDEIVVVGGRIGNPEQLVTQTEVYDGTSWRDAANIPVPGDHLAVTADSRYLYAVGGRKFSAGSNTDVVQRYDPKANRWTALPRTPQTVSGAGAAIVDGRLIVVGREGVTSVSGTVQAYDLTAPNATWTSLASLDPGRHGLGVTAIGNTLYAVGGATKAGHTASTNLVAALAVPARRAHAAAAWWPRHEAAVAVQQVNATVLDGRIWVAGGLTPSGEATASTQFYDPAINSWEQGPPLPEPVHHAMLVTYRDQLVVIGGFHSRDNDLLADDLAPDAVARQQDRQMGGWPTPASPARRRRRRRGRRQDRRRGRTHRQPRAAGHPDRGLRRHQLARRRRHPGARATTSPSPPTPATSTPSAAASSAPAATPTPCNATTRKPTAGPSCPAHRNRSAAPAPPSSTADSSSSAAKGSPASPAPSRPTT